MLQSNPIKFILFETPRVLLEACYFYSLFRAISNFFQYKELMDRSEEKSEGEVVGIQMSQLPAHVSTNILDVYHQDIMFPKPKVSEAILPYITRAERTVLPRYKTSLKVIECLSNFFENGAMLLNLNRAKSLVSGLFSLVPSIASHVWDFQNNRTDAATFSYLIQSVRTSVKIFKDALHSSLIEVITDIQSDMPDRAAEFESVKNRLKDCSMSIETAYPVLCELLSDNSLLNINPTAPYLAEPFFDQTPLAVAQRVSDQEPLAVAELCDVLAIDPRNSSESTPGNVPRNSSESSPGSVPRNSSESTPGNGPRNSSESTPGNGPKKSTDSDAVCVKDIFLCPCRPCKLWKYRLIIAIIVVGATGGTAVYAGVIGTTYSAVAAAVTSVEFGTATGLSAAGILLSRYLYPKG